MAAAARRDTADGGITELLRAWGRGEDEADSELMRRIYPELRRIARRHFRRQPMGHTLQPTALVHEALLRLGGQDILWQSSRQFYSLIALMMRRVLIDHARARKRRPVLVSLSDLQAPSEAMDVDVLALDVALKELETRYPFDAQVIDLRFFAGLTIDETARALDVGHTKIEESWAFARSWLRRRMGRDGR